MSVNNYIAILKEPMLRETVEELRRLILRSAPGLEEKIRYGVLFYDYSGMLCYINVRQKEAEVDLGLCKGYLHQRHLEFLDVKNRKQIRTLSFSNKSELHEEIIRDIIQEAVSINSLHKSRPHRAKR